MQDFKKEYENLMEKWEKECREWLLKEGLEYNNVTFFRDGIIDTDTWFKNDFRPLFILKEVHDKERKGQCVDFVAMKEGSDYDIWGRQGRGMWRALGTLAKGMVCNYHDPDVILPYEELYDESLECYRETLKQIAIINIKKLSSGAKEDSEESLQTKFYMCHAERFKNNLQTQINMINPTIIILCGKGINECFEIKENCLFGIPVVRGLHPSIQANCKREEFYTNTIKRVRDIVR